MMFRAKKARAPAASVRRRLLLGAGAAAAAGFPATGRAASAPVSLRFQGAWSAKDILHEHALDYARQVNEMSGGRLRIEVLPAGSVVKPHELLDAVEKGVLDGCHAAPAYWSAKDAAFSLFGSGPALGLDANLLLAWMRHGGGQALYDGLYASLLYRNIAAFLYGPLPAQPLGWFRQPLTSAAQFKGLRCHARAMPARMFRELGARVVDLPDEEIAPAARRGEIDAAASSSITSDLRLGLPQALPVCMLQSYHQPAQVLEVIVSRRRLDALSPDLQAIVARAAEAAGGELSWKAAHRHSSDYLALRETPGVRFLATPATVLRAQMQAWGEVARRSDRDSSFFNRIFGSQQAWARRAVGWSLASAVNPRIAYDHWFAGKAEDAGPARR